MEYKKLCFVSDITYLYYERSGALTDMGIKKNDKHNRIASEGMCIIDLKKNFYLRQRILLYSLFYLIILFGKFCL